MCLIILCDFWFGMWKGGGLRYRYTLYMTLNQDILSARNSYFQNWKILLQSAQKDPQISEMFEKCWLTDYYSSYSYNSTAFMSGLQEFLSNNPKYMSDVIINPNNTAVQASRCFVYSEVVDCAAMLLKLHYLFHEIQQNMDIPYK